MSDFDRPRPGALSDTSVLVLRGCRPEPIGSYLKALGILRLVADQADPAARGGWGDGGFVLHTRLCRAELVEFFLQRYEPTPILDPWNADFWEGHADEDPPVPKQAIGSIAKRAATEPRFGDYRSSLEMVLEVRANLTRGALAGRGHKAEKRALLLALRARLPDKAVEWLDAVAVVTDDGVSHPRLLGSGGNDSRFEISVRFAEALALACPPETKRRSGRDPAKAFEAAVFGEPSVPLEKLGVGFLDPGHAGGVNAGPLGKADGLANPWDFVLAVEGSVCFAAAAARRMSWRRSLPAEPFGVAGTPGTHQTSTEHEEAPEVWAPLWAAPASAAEIRRLLGEGRAVVGRRPARSSLDLAEAAASLGVDRGIDGFVRHAVVPRFGRQRLVVPVGQVAVVERPAVSLLEPVDAWIEPLRRVRREDLPWSVRRALGRLEQTEMTFATSGRARELQDVLGALADLEAAAAQAVGRKAINEGPLRGLGPVPGLPDRRWLPGLDDHSPELRLAVALASARWPARTIAGDDPPVGANLGALALLVRPLEQARGHLGFRTDGGSRIQLDGRPLGAVLGDVLVTFAQQHLEASLREPRDGESLPGVVLIGPRAVPAGLADVVAFVAGELQDRRFGELLKGLSLLAWRDERVSVPSANPEELGLVPTALCLLAPFAHGVRPSARHPALRASPDWAFRVRAGVVAPVLAEACHRLRWASLEPLVAHPELFAASVAPERLAAGLLFRLGPLEEKRLLWRVAVSREAVDGTGPPEEKEQA